MKSIHDILTDPDSLAKLSDQELQALLAPYIPASRQAVLPEEKAQKKMGAEFTALQEALKNPLLAASMEKLKATRNTQPAPAKKAIEFQPKK